MAQKACASRWFSPLAGSRTPFLPLGSSLLGIGRDATIDELLFGKHDREKAERALKARWEHPDVFVVAIVAIVEASCCSVRGRGLFAKRTAIWPSVWRMQMAERRAVRLALPLHARRSLPLFSPRVRPGDRVL